MKKLILILVVLVGCSANQPLPPEVVQQADKICEELRQRGINLENFVVYGHSCTWTAKTETTLGKCDCR